MRFHPQLAVARWKIAPVRFPTVLVFQHLLAGMSVLASLDLENNALTALDPALRSLELRARQDNIDAAAS